jgi:thiamine-monophosphate kinase
MALVKVSEIGEFRLIGRLSSLVGGDPPPELIVGIGDDCAVWQAGDQYLLATTDTLVEGVHFLRGAAPWADIGWKALAVNVSDIAAMGGVPLFALVTLALPLEMAVEATDALYDGLAACAHTFDVTIAGGDVVTADQMAITVALIGRAQMRDGVPLLMRREGGRANDVIAVTGSLGASAAGMNALREGAHADEPLPRAHLRPRPPLAIAQAAALLGVACAIDVSDGLLQDIGHICRASRLGAVLLAPDIPVDKDAAAAYPDDALRFAATGGEDYEIVFVGTAGVIAALNELHPEAVTTIGRMTDRRRGSVSLLDKTGAEIRLPDAGWDHLAPRKPA